MGLIVRNGSDIYKNFNTCFKTPSFKNFQHNIIIHQPCPMELAKNANLVNKTCNNLVSKTILSNQPHTLHIVMISSMKK